MRRSDPIDLLFKMMMGRTPTGISPFWSSDPSSLCTLSFCSLACALLYFFVRNQILDG
jgi:hypothetical protein